MDRAPRPDPVTRERDGRGVVWRSVCRSVPQVFFDGGHVGRKLFARAELDQLRARFHKDRVPRSEVICLVREDLFLMVSVEDTELSL